MMDAPEMIIVGGANGSGKTTFATQYFQALELPFLNADNIAKDLADRGVANTLIAAGRIFFQRLEELLAQRRTFIVETTLSGSYINKIAERARRTGFRITTIFIFLHSAEECVARVKLRVRKGGHSVPIEDIIRRYNRANRNFKTNFSNLSDSWLLLYNGTNGFQHVAVNKTGVTTVLQNDLYKIFNQLA